MLTRDEIAEKIKTLNKEVSDLRMQLASLPERQRLARLMITGSLENINILYKKNPAPYILELLSKAAADYGLAKATLLASPESINEKIQKAQETIAKLELILAEFVEDERLFDATLASIAAPTLLEVVVPTTTLPLPTFDLPPLPHHPEPTAAAPVVDTQPASPSIHVTPPAPLLGACASSIPTLPPIFKGS